MASPLFRSICFVLGGCLAVVLTGQTPAAEPRTIESGGLRFQFAGVDQGRAALGREDTFTARLSPFDRQVRMQSTDDPGTAAFLAFVQDQVIAWSEAEQDAIVAALERLDQPLGKLQLSRRDPVLLVHTTGREESNAAYTRGSAIILPRGKTGSVQRPVQRLLAHELFHVLSRGDHALRDRLYAIIGFQPANKIELPVSLRQRRMTNPDAPLVEHVIEVDLDREKKASLAPVLFAKSEFDPAKPSMFGYLQFKLMELRRDDDDRLVAAMAQGDAVLHDPTFPDFHRQIGGNTRYIIHPEEILADNFAALVTGGKVKDKWLIEAMRSEMTSDNEDAR